ncbi:class I SAM-dependent RNA methyltransferase [Ancylobacter terrae]|uniref:class I SAM-dependent RNA methyltransferase n=1 Tax=Ancylobacter sp. sgz301288 TaxID=3342077 RepID=UPI00385E35F8
MQHLTITRLGHRGDGIAETPDGPVFVPLALPGERVEVARMGERAQLVAVLEPSPERIEPFCPHVGPCGGCAFQHWARTPYRAWKRAQVVEALERAGLDAPVADLVDAHGAGRRRAVFHARGNGRKGGSGTGGRDTLAVGFAGRRSHAIVPIDRCPILDPALDGALPAAWAVAEVLAPLGKPLDLQATATDAGIDMEVRGCGPLKPALLPALADVAIRHKLARLTNHGELLFQREPPSLMMGRARVPLPPGGFLQATAAGEAALVAEVLAIAGTAGRVADLFAGVGTFALRLAERARVTALEASEPAVAALKGALRTASGLKPVSAEARDLFRRPLMAVEMKGFDAVVFDPPRQGAQAQAAQIAASTVPVVAGVSCDPSSFARDARALVDGGYRLERVVPVDQFRYSAHVEMVGLFRR